LDKHTCDVIGDDEVNTHVQLHELTISSLYTRFSQRRGGNNACDLVDCLRFGVTYCLHNKRRRLARATDRKEAANTACPIRQ
jgi:hypothetical protein